MKRALGTLLTGKDNCSLDIARVAVLIGVLMLCGCLVYGLIAYAVTVTAEFDLSKLGGLLKDFAAAMANVVGWGSVGIAAKAHAEPEGKDGDG